MEGLEKVMEDTNGDMAKIVTKAEVKRLLTDEAGGVVGVEYQKDGALHKALGPVIIATGGFGADYKNDSLLTKFRPELQALPTTNGEHCTGDGIKMAMAIGAGTIDMTSVQVHPTGIVHPGEPDAKVKFLAAEALRGVGGLLLNADGERFCDELGRRDYVSGEMNKNKGPFRLVLNAKASKEIEWHCKHYCGRGIMKRFASGAEVAKEIGVNPSKLAKTFADYNRVAQSKQCPYGKKFFHKKKTLPITKTRKRRKHTRVESDWKTYFGSSVKVQELLEEHGADAFDREIIRLCKTKGDCAYYETKEQFDREVLIRPDYYNGIINCRINRSHLSSNKIS